MKGRTRAGAIFLAALWTAVPAWVLAMDPRHGETDQGKTGGAMESLGERIFLGKAGPWEAEARLIDMKTQLEKEGVSAGAIAKLAAKHHLMVILTDPKTRRPAVDAVGEVTITGPDRSSSSKVPLIVMGEHIGSDVSLPKPGEYRFHVTVEGRGGKGSASFSYRLKR